jgi:23S rRNA (adenine2503-C2)-methyltransferase
MVMETLYGKKRQDIEMWLNDEGFNPVHAKGILSFLYRNDHLVLQHLPNALLDVVKELGVLPVLPIVKKQVANDGTIKYLFKLEDGSLIETVVMKQTYGLSICVTTQVGCNMACAFCASGLQKRVRNLTSLELVSQVLSVKNRSEERVTNVVLMGTGEPLDNLTEVESFLDILSDPFGIGLSHNRITLSTAGHIEGIKEIMNKNIRVNVALSLHASNDEVRNQLMPINKKYPIGDLMNTIKSYCKKMNKRVTIEYLMLRGVNDSLEHAKELSYLLKDLDVYVNLIPYNKVEELVFEASQKETIEAFRSVLIKEGIDVTVRKEHGVGIDAACGQLRNKN